MKIPHSSFLALTSCQGRTQFPSLHEQRKVPRDDLTANTNGLVPRVAKKVSSCGNDFALVFISPSSIIAIAVDSQTEISSVCDLKRFAVVQSFERLEINGKIDNKYLIKY